MNPKKYVWTHGTRLVEDLELGNKMDRRFHRKERMKKMFDKLNREDEKDV